MLNPLLPFYIQSVIKDEAIRLVKYEYIPHRASACISQVNCFIGDSLQVLGVKAELSYALPPLLQRRVLKDLILH